MRAYVRAFLDSLPTSQIRDSREQNVFISDLILWKSGEYGISWVTTAVTLLGMHTERVVLRLAIHLGAPKIFEYELRRTCQSPNRLSWSGLLDGVINSEYTPRLPSRPKRLATIAQQEKIIEIIFKYAPASFITSERSRIPEYLMSFPKLMVPAYIKQIGNARGFTYSALNNALKFGQKFDRSWDRYHMRNVRFIERELSKAMTKDHRRATSRFVLEQWQPTKNGRRLPDNMVQKTLHKAGLSNVNANTPNSNATRKRNLSRDAPYVRNIIRDMREKRRPSPTTSPKKKKVKTNRS
jgi:hypothetical protein